MNKYVRVGITALACAYFWYYVKTYTGWHFIDSADVIFHEAGHWIFAPFGTFTQVLMGSGFQILLPLLISFYFFKTTQRMSASFCLLWAGANFLSVSVYAKDAIAQNLPLIGGDSTMHDWNYLLGVTHSFNHTELIANSLFLFGIASITTGTIFALYCAWTTTETLPDADF